MNEGIPSGLVTGLFTYLLTSRSKYALHATFLTFFGVSTVYFKLCQDEYRAKLKENEQIGEIMNLIVKYRGTEMEGKLKEEYKERVSRLDEKSKYV